MNSARTTAGDTDTISGRVRWVYDQQSAVVTVTEADPGTDPSPERRVLTRVMKTDVPDGGGKGGVALIFWADPQQPGRLKSGPGPISSPAASA